MTDREAEREKQDTPKTSHRRHARRKRPESRKVKDRETKSAAAPPSKWGKLKASMFGLKPTPIGEQLVSLPPRALEQKSEPSAPPVEEAKRQPEPTEDTPPAAPLSSPLPEPIREPELPAEEKKDSGKKKAHGSQKRQMEKTVAARLTPSEYAAVAEKSASAGLTLSAYARACLLGDPGLRAKRAPPLNRAALGEAIAALNRVGNNLNQIAHHLNAGGHPDRAAIAESNGKLDACLSAISKALGRAE